MSTPLKPIAFLDSHVVVWLYDALTNKFSDKAKDVINSHDLLISPIVLLELQDWKDKHLIKDAPDKMAEELEHTIGLEISDTPFIEIVRAAYKLDWAKDNYDRLITAEATVHKAPLITADHTVRVYYNKAIW